MSEAVCIVRATLGSVALSFTLTDAASAQRGTPANLRDFDTYAANAMKDWKVPGIVRPRLVPERLQGGSRRASRRQHRRHERARRHAARGEAGRLNYAGVSDGVLEHWHYDTFRGAWTNRLLGKSMVTFVIDATAKVAEMKIENLADFKRAAAKADTATRGGQGAEADAASGAGARSTVLAPFSVRPPAAARATSRSLPTGWR